MVRAKTTETERESQRRMRRRRMEGSAMASLKSTPTVRPFLCMMVVRDGILAICRAERKFATTPATWRARRPTRPAKRSMESTTAVMILTTTDAPW